MEKIGIIIPAVNCLEYSKKTIDSIKTSHPYEIIFIDNGSTDGTKDWLKTQSFTKIIDPQVSGLAAVWNLSILKARELGCSLFLVLNNDIILSPTTIDNLVKKMSTGKYVMATGVNQHEGCEKPEDMLLKSVEYKEDEPDNEHPDFSCFLINDNTIDKIGWFDENFITAYFEDSDYHARIALSGEKAVSTISAIYYHFESKTVKMNPQIREIVKESFEHNRDYFKEKWGHENVGDVPEMRKKYWKNPFNDPKKDIKNITNNYIQGIF
jgi:GT2 family glycosyltransferase